MLLQHPLINTSEVARRFYEKEDQPPARPHPALMSRVYGNPTRKKQPEELSDDTLERLTMIFTELYHDLIDEDVIL